MRILHRAVGLLIIGAALAGAVLLGWAVSGAGGAFADAPSRGVVLGVWTVLYDAEAPSVGTLAGAIGLALVLAAGVAWLEQRIATTARRSDDREHQPLAPKIVMAATRGVYAGPVTITVLVPAHNEEARLPATLRALLGQSHRPDRVIVVADNCTDDTVAIARSAGVEVVETVENRRKKAGALNQVLKRILPDQGDTTW